MKISRRQLRKLIESTINEQPDIPSYPAADSEEGQAKVDLAEMGNFPVSESFTADSLMTMYGNDVRAELNTMVPRLPTGGSLKGANLSHFDSTDDGVNDDSSPCLIDFGAMSVQNFLSKYTDPFRFAEDAKEKHKYKYQRFPTKEQPLYFMSMFFWDPKHNFTQDQLSDLEYSTKDLVVKNNTGEGVVLIDMSIGNPGDPLDPDYLTVFASGIFLKKIDSTIKLTNFLESHGIDPLGGS